MSLSGGFVEDRYNCTEELELEFPLYLQGSYMLGGNSMVKVTSEEELTKQLQKMLDWSVTSEVTIKRELE